MYLDVNGLITQKDGDGGDKLQRTGFWWTGMYLNDNYQDNFEIADYPHALEFLTDVNGNLQRDEIKYTSLLDPNDVSRDQLIPNVVACGLYSFEDRVKRILSNAIRNRIRYPNNDVAFLTDFARFFRALRMWYLYPAIIVCDMWLLLSSLFLVVRSWFDYSDKYVGDDLNFIADLAQTKNVYPTPFSYIARKIFKYLRRGGPMHGMNVYFDPSTGANPEFIYLWQPIVDSF